MDEIRKLIDNVNEVEDNSQLNDGNQFDNGNNECSIPGNELVVISRGDISELKLYNGDSTSVLTKSETLRLFSTNPELEEKYNKLKRMITDINKEMIEFNKSSRLGKVKLSKRKKKAEEPDDKLAKKINADLIFENVLDGKISSKLGADLLNIKYEAFIARVYRKKKKMALNLDLGDLRKYGNYKKVNEETTDLIYDYISRNHDTMIKHIRDFLLKKQIDISKTTICNIKNKLDITYKQSAQIRNIWNDKEMILKRKRYAEEYKRLLPREFIYIDEVYFNRHTINQNEDGSEGQRIILTPGSTLKSVNYIGAISEFGIVSYRIVDKTKTNTSNQEDFDYFMYDLYSKNRHKQIVYVFNSTNTHAISDQLKEAIRSSFSFILKLPEYSVFLSPIELFFNALKSGVNKLAHGENSDVIKNIIKVQNKIGDGQHCEHYFKHARKYVSLCDSCCMFKGSIFEPDTILPKDVTERLSENVRE
ncbi:hypothetical protein K502DRAFT_350136 [Neoconidiobolus thromboides FSU 785]|nr:hypothetical protein K502DRAFT_350136 [Neoconidiobolus thromboides FSU 785]